MALVVHLRQPCLTVWTSPKRPGYLLLNLGLLVGGGGSCGPGTVFRPRLPGQRLPEGTNNMSSALRELHALRFFQNVAIPSKITSLPDEASSMLLKLMKLNEKVSNVAKHM